MTKSDLLTALGIHASPRIRAIHWSHDRFEQTLTELWRGDSSTGSGTPARPEVVEALESVDAEWRQYDSIFGDLVSTSTVSSAQIDALAQSHARLAMNLEEMVAIYQRHAHGGQNHSILSPMIEETEQLRANTQQVLRGLLMVAYREPATAERVALAQMAADFDRILNGLLSGDADLQLLPAPTPDIRDELLKVSMIWSKTRPILESAAAGNPVTEREIVTIAGHATDMAVPLTMALIMYLSL